MALEIIHLAKLKQFGIKLCSHSCIKEGSKRWASKYFVTTPIYYVNAVPHIGHLYTALIGDATVRFQKLKNPDLVTKYMVGTDEHGLKVSQAARGTDVQTYCDNISAKFRDLFNLYSIETNDFVRTTEERHSKAVMALWNKLFSKNLIYKEKYSGWYCISDEVFVSETLLDPKVGEDGCRYTLKENKSVQFMEEINYKFKLSNFENDILYWLQGDVVHPQLFKTQLLKWIEQGVMKDLSVSRPVERVPWGIPVPGDPSQTIYVWLDALSSYLCADGYPDSSFKWPPDLQIIGKDILKFHGLFWPAFLMAADLEPPKCIFCHSHWRRNNEKMSKSKGNVVDPFQQSKKYTSDGFRFFLLKEGLPHNDGNFIDSLVPETLNASLADTLGNLLCRCTGSVLNPKQVFPLLSEPDHIKLCGEPAENLINALKELPEIVQMHFEKLHFYKGIDAVIKTLILTNQFFQHQAPWELCRKPTSTDHLNSVLHLTMESLRVCGILLQPIIPNISNALLNKLSISKNKRNLKDVHSYSWENPEESKASDLMSENVIIFPKLKIVQ